MNKERKHIDNLFQDELRDFSKEVSMDDFDSIMEKMNQKKKRRFPFWWFVMGVAGILLATSVVYTLQYEPSNNVATTEFNTNEFSFKDKEENFVSIGDAEGNSSTIAELENTDLSSLKSGSDVKRNLDQEVIRSKGDRLVNVSSSSKSKNTRRNTEVKERSNSDKLSEKGLSNEKRLSKANVLNDSKDLISSKEDSKEKGVAVKQPQNLTPQLGKDSVQSEVTKTEDKNFNKGWEKDSMLDKEDESLVGEKTSKQSLSLVGKWSVEAMGSYLQSAQMINSSNDYASIRQNGETPEASFNFGIQVKRNFGSGLSFGFGAESNTFSNSASYLYERKKYDLLPVLNPGGDTIGYFKSNFRDTMEDYKTINKISTLRLPITMSYRRVLGKNGFMIGGGLYMDYITKVSGELPEDKEFIPTKANEIFNQKVLFGLSTELGYFRPLSNSINLEIRARYNTSFTDLLKSNEAEDKRKQFGVGIGLSYNF